MAEQIAVENSMDVSSDKAMTVLIHNVRNAVSRNRHNLTTNRHPETGAAV
jgi:hypothetical protein